MFWPFGKTDTRTDVEKGADALGVELFGHDGNGLHTVLKPNGQTHEVSVEFLMDAGKAEQFERRLKRRRG